MTKQEKIIDQIKKLLRLAGNNNSPEEAAAAAAMAQRLQLEHDIAVADITEEGEGAELEPVIVDWITPGATRQTWRAELWYGVCAGNGCHGYTRSGRRFGTRSRFTVAGRTSNVQAAIYTYRWLVKEVDRLAKQAVASKNFWVRGDARRFGNSFRVGAAEVISTRLRRARQDVFRQAEERGQTAALVRVRDDAEIVKAEADRLVRPGKGTFRGSGGSSFSGLRAGREAGRSVTLTSNARLSSGAKRIGGGK